MAGIIEPIDASTHWSTPPASSSCPTYVAVLEIANLFTGASLWGLVGGIVNLRRLTSPEVKACLAALKAGGALLAGPVAGSFPDRFKRRPRCAETIRFEAPVCRFCNHEFNEAEVKAAQEQAQIQLARLQTDALRVRRSSHAGFWVRLVALRIDTVILDLLALLAGGAFIVVFTLFSRTPSDGTMGLALCALLAAFFLLYFPLLESSRRQATLGKMAFGVAVTDLGRNRISFARALARTLAKVLLGLPFSLGYLLAAFTKNKQALHDFIASTLVVPKDSIRPRSSAAGV